LFGSIIIDDAKAIDSLNKADKKARESKEALNKVQGAAKTMGTVMVAGAGAAVGALGGMAFKSAETTDRIDKLSQKIGLSRTGFQEWEYVLSQNGMSIETLQGGMKTLVGRIDEAITGTGEGAESFEKLGVSVLDANGNVKDQETLFNESVNRSPRNERWHGKGKTRQ